jgi:hypothetical protein
MRFHSPDVGTGSPGANQGGATSVDSGVTAPVDPFAGIDLNDLDVETRKTVEKAKAEFASLQKKFEDTEKARKVEEEQKKGFQKRYDEMFAKQGQQTPPDPEVQLRKEVVQLLISEGLPPAQAEAQAPIFIKLNARFAENLKKDIGRDLAPFAGSVLSQQATTEWHKAVEADAQGKVAALQNQEVAQLVWDEVQNMVKAGQNVTAQTILNLRGMIYTDYLEKGGEPTQMQNTPPPTRLPNMGRTSYPGGGSVPFRPQQTDPNAAKHSLNQDTLAALEAVQKDWGHNSKQFPTIRNGGRK